MIKVLIVDDSSVSRRWLEQLLTSDVACQVIGHAANGEEALRFVQRQRPDVITMDMDMPGMNGLEATRRIMEVSPVPILIVTGSMQHETVFNTFDAIEAGAVAVVGKPRGHQHALIGPQARHFIDTVKSMSRVPVVRRWARTRMQAAPAAITPQASDAVRFRVVAVGASTGGPPVLRTLISRLPKPFSVPVLVVQHIAPGFLAGMVDWLRQATQRDIVIARQGELTRADTVYFAPDGYHLGIKRDGRLQLTASSPDDSICPSVAHLFHSVAEAFGNESVGVLLTGMGQDGARDLKRMRDRGAVTIAQNQETATVFGMPGEAIRLDAASHVMAPEEIADWLAQSV